MFTIKFYSADGYRQIIREAESFTILRGPHEQLGSAEITLHQKNPADDRRYDVKDENALLTADSPQCFAKAIIENSAGRTTEIVTLRHIGSDAPADLKAA